MRLSLQAGCLLQRSASAATALQCPLTTSAWQKAHLHTRPQQRHRRAGHHSAADTRATTQAAPSDVFVLDFDGVICDSEPEVSTSAYAAAAQRWPQHFSGLAPEQVAAVKAGLRKTRPRLVEGYEALVMARLLVEDPQNEAHILKGWDALLAATLARWQEDSEQLQDLFEQHRRLCMNGKPEEWTALNPFFPGVAEALQDCPYPFYIASSKAASRLSVLLKAGLPQQEDLWREGSPRVFASLLPPNTRKAETLRAIMARPLAQARSTTLHFIDDRFETLEALCHQSDLAGRWRLHFATWGYSTDAERTAVMNGALPGVRPLGLPHLCELLRWGVVMGVDDGCEPTAEEVEQGVAGSARRQRQG